MFQRIGERRIVLGMNEFDNKKEQIPENIKLHYQSVREINPLIEVGMGLQEELVCINHALHRAHLFERGDIVVVITLK